MFGWKRKLRPINPTQELAGKIISTLNVAKTPRSLMEICNSNNYLSCQSPVRVKRMLDVLIQDGRVKFLRKEAESGTIQVFYFTKEE